MAMDWLQVFTIVGSTVGCCFYFRKESQADLHEMKTEVGTFKQEMKNDMREMREMMAAFQRTVHQETKDFHGRLCQLEEKYQTNLRGPGRPPKAEK